MKINTNTPKYLKTKKKSVKNECVKNTIANVLDIFAYSFGFTLYYSPLGSVP